MIIAKDLPVPTQEDELREVFSKYGTVMRVLMPPYGSTAIVEFQEPSEAKRAFTKLAYRRVIVPDFPLFVGSCNFLFSFLHWHLKGFSSEHMVFKADLIKDLADILSQACPWVLHLTGCKTPIYLLHLSAWKFYRLGQ